MTVYWEVLLTCPFLDEATEVQRSEVTCPWCHMAVESDLGPSLLGSKPGAMVNPSCTTVLLKGL